MGLLFSDKTVLQSSDWINDNIIYAAQKLLRKEFPDIEGLKSPLLGTSLAFKCIPHNSKYIQILHVNGNHWICVSNIGLLSREPVKDRTFVYDSFVSKSIECHTKLQICSFVQPSNKLFRFEIMNIMVQPNTFDCGLFAVANMIEIAFGGHPGKCVWDTKQFRPHLIACLEEEHLVPFPKLKERRVPFSRAVQYLIEEKIYCDCRMPFDQVSEMICCKHCNSWYHCDCIGMENVAEYSRRKWICKKCISVFH